MCCRGRSKNWELNRWTIRWRDASCPLRGKMPRLSMAEPIIVTPRLSLREMTWDDLDFLATLLGDPAVMRYYPKIHTREESALWLQRVLDRYAKDGHAFWLVEDRKSGKPIGQVGLL